MIFERLLKFLFPEHLIFDSYRRHGLMLDDAEFERAVMGYSLPDKTQTSATQTHIPDNQRELSSAWNIPKRSNEPYGDGNLFNDKEDQILERAAYTQALESDRYAKINDYDFVRGELAARVIGQKNALTDLVLAFKRPFITGENGNKPRNTIFLIGSASSGRDFIVDTTVAELKKRGLLRHANPYRVDLSLYRAVTDKDLFLMDIYKALYTGPEVIIFNDFELCHPLILDVLRDLITEGRHKLPARYSLQGNNLLRVEGMLTGDTMSEFNAVGKYFIFRTSLTEHKIWDVYGNRVMSSVGDIIHMDPYTKDEIKAFVLKLLDKLIAEVKSKLDILLTCDASMVSHLVDMYSSSTGFDGLDDYIKAELFRALSECKLRKTVADKGRVSIYADALQIMLRIKGQEALPLSRYLPRKYTNSVDEVKKELDSIIGLTEVKNYILSLENNFNIQKRRRKDGLKETDISMHMVFTGNPGTGKTTIARIIAKYLKAVGVLSVGQLREVSRADLVGQYVGHTARITNEAIKSAIGGVLFIDEAYAICRDKQDAYGKEAVDTLVKGIEDNRDRLVVILAGYKDEMKEFMNINPGLQSRFPVSIEFPDYTDAEMLQIAELIASSKGYNIDEVCKPKLLRFFEKSSVKGRNDSGNGRLVRNVVEAAILAQSGRISSEAGADLCLLTEDDFNLNEVNFDLEKSLAAIVGLENIKDFVRGQHKLILADEKRRKAGLDIDTTQSLNMIFAGNPGTGKTTVARLMASMLRDMGLLKKGHLVETDRAGLVAEYAGQTPRKTEELFRSALGGVLFIDEAYSLNDHSGVGKEALDTLVRLIEEYREDIVVILAGYKKEMADFLKSNSGLTSRFPLRVDFNDYSLDELYQIALKMIYAKGFKITADGEKALMDAVAYEHRYASVFSGNGRMVRNLVEKVMRNQSARIVSAEYEEAELVTIRAVDFDDKKVHGSYDLDTAFAGIIGMEQVKSYLRSLYARLRVKKERKRLGLQIDTSGSLHMIFKGNPGTGKTMMARIVAEIFANIGITPSNKLVETDRAGLVAGYVGQTALKTQEKIMEAMGGVLFIDEAYALSNGGPQDYGREAIDTLVKLMDDNRNKLIVILAGYSDEMDRFLTANPGLTSRFPYIIDFPDYSLDELMVMALSSYEKRGYKLSTRALDKLHIVFAQAMRKRHFGNGRYVRNVFERSVNQQALRLSQADDMSIESLTTIEAEDIESV